MLLARSSVGTFAQFVRCMFSAQVTIHMKQKGDELGRFLIGTRFFIIRQQNFETAMENASWGEAEVVEVHCSDKEKLNEVTKRWDMFLESLKDDEKNKPDNGSSV